VPLVHRTSEKLGFGGGVNQRGVFLKVCLAGSTRGETCISYSGGGGVRREEAGRLDQGRGKIIRGREN